MKATPEGDFSTTDFTTKLTCARFFNEFMCRDLKNSSYNRTNKVSLKNKYSELYSVNDELVISLRGAFGVTEYP
jgi:hypothetical protein